MDDDADELSDSVKVAHSFLKANRNWLVNRYGPLALDPFGTNSDALISFPDKNHEINGPSAGAGIAG